MTLLFGAIEAGGTSFRCAIGNETETIDSVEFSTGAPGETLRRAAEFVTTRGPVAALGVAMFGPLDLKTGRTLRTPKSAWQDIDVRGELQRAARTTVCIETDVNAAALAEWHARRERSSSPFVYVTVGTGIGGGAVVHGTPLHGILHPEMGYMRVARHVDRAGCVDAWEGACAFHGACVEGLASGAAIQKRTGRRADELDDGHPVWDSVADALSQLVNNLVLVLSPSHVVLGGGVMARHGLRERVATQTDALLAHYLPARTSADPLILEPVYAHSGLAGAFALARGSHLPSAPENGPRSAA